AAGGRAGGAGRVHVVVGDRRGQPGVAGEAGGALLPAAAGPSLEMADDVILETEALTKEFRGFVAVKDVKLRVRRGTIHALIGPNGAGKTTCFNLLTHFLTPTRGRIRFNGRDITGSRPADIARQMLLLDEPTAGMAHDDVDRISALIKRVAANRTVLMVEHNLRVVENLSDTITVLARGEILAEGDYRSVSRNADVIQAYMG